MSCSEYVPKPPFDRPPVCPSKFVVYNDRVVAFYAWRKEAKDKSAFVTHAKDLFFVCKQLPEDGEDEHTKHNMCAREIFETLKQLVSVFGVDAAISNASRIGGNAILMKRWIAAKCIS